MRESNKVELTALLSDAFQAKEWAHWQEKFAQYGITCGRIAKTEDHCDDEQVLASGAVTEFEDGAGRTVDSPLFVEGAAKRAPRGAPAVGQHNLAILRELGIDEALVKN